MEKSQVNQGTTAEWTTISYAPLVVDLTGYSVTVNGRAVALTLAQFLIFKELVLNPYRFLDRATLLLATNTPEYQHSPLSLRAIDSHVSRIRRKLAQAGYDCIRTMRSVGYRFVRLEIPPPDAP